MSTKNLLMYLDDYNLTLLNWTREVCYLVITSYGPTGGSIWILYAVQPLRNIRILRVFFILRFCNKTLVDDNQNLSVVEIGIIIIEIKFQLKI